jgi:hypothetical protein
MKQILGFLLLTLASLTAAKNTKAGSLVLNWNASASPQIAGYNVYYGTTSGHYPFKLTAGNATSITISNLTLGATYYFVATAYDSKGNESNYSSELKALVSVALALIRRGARSPALLQFPVEIGHRYEIQASPDCRTWNWIWRSGVFLSNAVIEYADRDSISSKSRFYRLKVSLIGPASSTALSGASPAPQSQ